MTYGLSNNCTKNYYNRTLTVQVIVEDVVTWIFLRQCKKNTSDALSRLHDLSLDRCLSDIDVLVQDFLSCIYDCVEKSAMHHAYKKEALWTLGYGEH